MKKLLAFWQAVKCFFKSLEWQTPDYSVPLKNRYDGRYKLARDRNFKSDADALRSDWEKVGIDFQKVLGDWESKK